MQILGKHNAYAREHIIHTYTETYSAIVASHTHTHTNTHTHTYTQMHTNTNKHTRTHTHTHTHTHTGHLRPRAGREEGPTAILRYNV